MTQSILHATAPPSRPAKIADTTASRIEAALGGLGAMVLATMLAIVALAAAARYLVGIGIFGSDELAIWLFALVVALGLPSLATSALAMRLDLLPSALDRRARALVDMIAEGVACHAGLVFLFGGVEVMRALGGTSTSLGLPEWLRFAAVPAGAVLMLVLLVLRAAAAGRLPAGLAAIALGVGLHAATTVGWGVAVSSPALFAGGIALAWTFIGVPLPLAVVSAAAVAIPLGSTLPLSAIVQTTVSGFGKFLLLAIPFFLLAGVVMQTGGLAERLQRFASAFVGHLRGGIAQSTLLTNTLFAGVSGSSIADAAFGAKALAPSLRAAGYAPARATAIVAATSILPNIIPPSIAFLILAHATALSVGPLFAGGLVAGLVLAAVFAVTLHVGGAVEGRGPPRVDRSGRIAATLGALPVFGLALVILLGIRLGAVTPTEAAALAACYALVTALTLRGAAGLFEAFTRAARETAAVGLLVGTAAPFVFLVAVDGLPGQVSALMSGLGPAGVLVVANLLLLVVGCLLDIGAAILLFAPLLLPAAIAAGIDPVAFGVLVVVNLMIGGLTPPVGVLVYVAAGLAGLPAGQVFRAVTPFVAVLVAALALMSAAVWLHAIH